MDSAGAICTSETYIFMLHLSVIFQMEHVVSSDLPTLKIEIWKKGAGASILFILPNVVVRGLRMTDVNTPKQLV